MILGRRTFSLRIGTIVKQFEGEILLRLEKSYELDVRPVAGSEINLFHIAITSSEVYIATAGMETECLCIPNDDSFRLLRSPVRFIESSTLVRFHSAVVNFGIRDIWNRKTVLQFYDWVITLYPTGEHTVEYPKDIQSDSYKLTHHITADRSGALFTPDEANQMLRYLSQFLGFCQGGWVAFVLMCGQNEKGNVVYEEWGAGKVDEYKDVSAWLDRLHIASVPEVFSGFMTRMVDASFAEAMQRVLYWNLRGNTENVGPDGALILLQAALERLAHFVLVEDRVARGLPEVSSANAGDKILKMLEELKIPVAIPAELSEMTLLSPIFSWISGPQALAQLRNDLTHPKQKFRGVRVPWYEAYLLAKWYLEMSLLRLFNYTGVYSNRLRTHRWVGQVDKVPWL